MSDRYDVLDIRAACIAAKATFPGSAWNDPESDPIAALDALVAERDVLQHIIDCADTPLMRDVLAQRDEALNQVANMTQSVQVIQNDRAKLIEQSIAAEAEVARLRAWAASFNCFEPNEDGVPVCGGTCIPCSARAALAKEDTDE